jgi:hypothetical protein
VSEKILWGEDPIETTAAVCHLGVMSLLVPLLIALVLFGGGGFYFGGPIKGGIGIGVILLTCLFVYIAGGFRILKSATPPQQATPSQPPMRS